MGGSRPTHRYRIRRQAGFNEREFAYFEAACRVFQARVRSFQAEWTALATTCELRAPTVEFFPPELSDDRTVASQPVCIENQTLGSRSLFRELAKDLYHFLPVEVMLDIEFGIVEPPHAGSGPAAYDWWNPHVPFGSGSSRKP